MTRNFWLLSSSLYLLYLTNLVQSQGRMTSNSTRPPTYHPTPYNESSHETPDRCNPREYVQRGYCTKYFTCNRKSQLELKRSCSDGLFWNPNFNSIHGGVCDYLRNIEKETLFEYKKDTKCVLDVSYFRSSGECSAKYFFNHPTRTEGREVEESCSQGLVWSKDKESCEICSLVTKKDGTPCCDTPESDY